MLGGFLLLVIATALTGLILQSFASKYSFFSSSFMWNVYIMHLLLMFLYYWYASFNPSDSQFYYTKVLIDYRGPAWFDFYGTSTTFIEWVGYPFIKYLNFSYEAVMVLFSYLGYLGFVYFYIFFRENLRFRHTFLGIDLLLLIFLLPNLHFWSVSFGKGSLIFFGIALVMFSLNNPTKRLWTLLIGSLIVYHVRPHVMLVIITSALVSFTFSSRGVSTAARIGMIALALISFAFIYQDVLALVGIEQGEEMSQGLDLTHRATELTKATSGVDITSYSLPLQVFTFLYRPLFVDAPGLLGLFVSVENVFYLILTLQILNFKGIKFLIKSDFRVKTAFFSFITVSIALAQISGNLGLAIRQKSQVMILFLFVILAFMDSKKYKKWKSQIMLKKKMRKTNQAISTAIS